MLKYFLELWFVCKGENPLQICCLILSGGRPLCWPTRDASVRNPEDGGAWGYSKLLQRRNGPLPGPPSTGR